MIIDIHTHLADYSLDFGDKLKDDMAQCGISADTWSFTEEDYLRGTSSADKVVVFGLKAAKTGWFIPNETVAEFVSRHSDKYIFFASIDPSEDGYMEELTYNHIHLKCKGIKIGAVYQGVHPCDSRYYDIYAYCQKHGLPVLTHSATTFSSGTPLDYARPFHFDRIACDFPELKIVLAHLGHPWEGETLAIIRRNRNVYADISALYYRPWQFYNSMRLAVEYGCTAKLLFGSDFPATTTQGSLDGVRNLNHIIRGSGLPEIPLEVIEGILHRDSLTLLNLK